MSHPAAGRRTWMRGIGEKIGSAVAPVHPYAGAAPVDPEAVDAVPLVDVALEPSDPEAVVTPTPLAEDAKLEAEDAWPVAAALPADPEPKLEAPLSAAGIIGPR